MRILGNQFGIEIGDYITQDRKNGRRIKILSEDDNNWFEVDEQGFSSFWLNDLKSVIELAIKHLEKEKKANNKK